MRILIEIRMRTKNLIKIEICLPPKRTRTTLSPMELLGGKKLIRRGGRAEINLALPRGREKIKETRIKKMAFKCPEPNLLTTSTPPAKIKPKWS